MKIYINYNFSSSIPKTIIHCFEKQIAEFLNKFSKINKEDRFVG